MMRIESTWTDMEEETFFWSTSVYYFSTQGIEYKLNHVWKGNWAPKQQQLLHFRWLNWSLQTVQLGSWPRKKTFSPTPTRRAAQTPSSMTLLFPAQWLFMPAYLIHNLVIPPPGLLHFLCRCQFLRHGFRDRPHSPCLERTALGLIAVLLVVCP